MAHACDHRLPTVFGWRIRYKILRSVPMSFFEKSLVKQAHEFENLTLMLQPHGFSVGGRLSVFRTKDVRAMEWDDEFRLSRAGMIAPPQRALKRIEFVYIMSHDFGETVLMSNR